MNLKILFMLLVYYSILSMMFGLSSGLFADAGFNTTINLNDSELSSDELDEGGLFSTGISFTRFATLITFGIGLPESTPAWFKTIFFIWQTLITIFAVGFVISSIWDG